MTLWDSFAERHPEIADITNYVEDILLDTPRTEDQGAYALRRFIATEYQDELFEQELESTGILGAGAWLRSGEPVAALFVHPILYRGQPRRLHDSPLGRTLEEMLRVDLPEPLIVVPLIPPIPFRKRVPGTGLLVGDRHGTAGNYAEWNGQQGFLTAGHVAPMLHAPVRDRGGNRLGLVAETLHRHNTPPAPGCPDVAFIKTPSIPPSVRPAAVRAPIEGEGLRLIGQKGPATTWVQGIAQVLRVRRTEPAWGEVILTGDPVAVPGDSGGAVYGTDVALVGHIVGGAPGAYSVVQDIQYQLNALGAVALG